MTGRHTLCLVTIDHYLGNMTFFVVLNEDGWPVKMRTSGWHGKPRSTDVQPFIVEPDGKLDFGQLPDDPGNYDERWAAVDLLNRQIFEGREVRVEFSDDGISETVCQVIEIQEILGSGPKAKLPA